MIPPVPHNITEKDARCLRGWVIWSGPPPSGWVSAGQPRSLNHARVALAGVAHAVHAVREEGTNVYVPLWVDAALDLGTFPRNGDTAEVSRVLGMLALWWGAVNQEDILAVHDLGGSEAVREAVLAECDFAAYVPAVKHRYELLGLVTG